VLTRLFHLKFYAVNKDIVRLAFTHTSGFVLNKYCTEVKTKNGYILKRAKSRYKTTKHVHL